MVDTNVYNFLYLQYLPELNKLIEEQKVVIYGCRVVRRELRDISPNIKYNAKNFRNTLLAVYDALTKKHNYPLEDFIESLAEQYWQEYNGGISKRKLIDDFRIVAISSAHNLDIIASEDENSMKSAPAIKAYLKVNNTNGFRTPAFYSLKELLST